MFLRRGSACTAPLFCAGPAVKGDGWFIGGFRETGDRPVRTPAPTGVVFYRGFPVDEHGAPGSSRPTEAGHQGRGEGFDGPSQCRESRRTMCAPTYGIPTGTAAFAAVGQRNNQQVSEASRGEGGRAAAAVYHRAIDGGMVSGYLYLCESYRRREEALHQALAPNCRGGVATGGS